MRQRIATLEATNRVLEQEKTQLQHCLQRSVEITPQRLERLLLTGIAEMLPYETLQTVVKVAYGPEYVPSVGHLSALVNHTGTIAGLILNYERVTSAFQAAACDEIFFHQQPILTVVEPETMAIGAIEKISDLPPIDEPVHQPSPDSTKTSESKRQVDSKPDRSQESQPRSSSPSSQANSEISTQDMKNALEKIS